MKRTTEFESERSDLLTSIFFLFVICSFLFVDIGRSYRPKRIYVDIEGSNCALPDEERSMRVDNTDTITVTIHSHTCEYSEHANAFMHRVYIYLYTHASRIIGSEHLSYKIVMDTCQGNIKLGSSIQNYLRVRLYYAGYMHMHVQDILVDRDGKLRYHARPRASLMRCGLTPLCFPTL